MKVASCIAAAIASVLGAGCLSPASGTTSTEAGDDAAAGADDAPWLPQVCPDTCHEEPPACWRYLMDDRTCECELFVNSDTTRCDDGTACTIEDACLDGTCLGAPACDDGDPCSDDACIEPIGLCRHTQNTELPGCPPDALCRSYASLYVDDREPPVQTTCHFDLGSSTLDCVATDQTRTTRFGSTAAFVTEAGLGMRTREHEAATLVEQSDWERTWAYDASDRPVSASGPVDTTTATTNFSEWDNLGRPLRSTWDLVGVCSGLERTYEYDDDAATITVRWVIGTGGNCVGYDWFRRYDADGNEVELGTDSPDTPARLFTILETTSVCVGDR